MSLALVFPGQGSQRPGLGAPWRADPGWSLVERASDLLHRDVEQLLLDADAEQLRATSEAQLSTFLISLLAWQALLTRPILDVSVLAGHSLGELTALVAGGILTCDDGLGLVHARGAAMQLAAELAPGAMAAVLGLEDDAVERVCAGLDDVWPANYNAPDHVVVSGTVAGLAAAGSALRAAGARRVLSLPVGGAFHTPLMAPARDGLEIALREVSYAAPVVPVLSGVEVRLHAADVPAVLSRQLTAPVRWRQVVEALPGYGVDTVVEIGPGGVLAGLVRRTLPQMRVVSLATASDVARFGG
jgi:[acyl-carrier-protein] S-malonyltransferase